MRRIIGNRPIGVWVALGAFTFYLVFGMGGQALSLIDWDLAVSWGLQENSRDDPEVLERALSRVEWGVCAADMIVQVPLLIAAILGIACRRVWGLIAGFMASATMVYIFFVYALGRYGIAVQAGLAPWGDFAGIVVLFAILGLVPGILGFWGLAANAERFLRGAPRSHMLRRREDGLAASFLEDLLLCSGQTLRAIPRVWIATQRNWNTTREDVERELESDAWIENPRALNRAITIDRPPEKVWPWIAQLGRGAAYYSWDFLDNPKHRHPDYLLEKAPPAAPGDRNAGLGRIRHVDPGRELAWFDEADFMGLKMPLSMSFRLDPEDGRATRLLYRMSLSLPNTLRGRLAFRIGLLMDHVMSTEMMRRLKLLIETYEERLEAGETNRDLAPHQETEWTPVKAGGNDGAPIGSPSD